MIRKDGSEQKGDEMKGFLPPGIVFVLVPALSSLFGVLILSRLPWLISAYNYLRGAPSPIDQSALALLGSDLSRIAVLSSCIIGMVIGLYLFRFVTTKLDAVRKEGETEISVRMYLALLLSWELFILPIQAIWFLDLVVYGYPTSSFLRDLGYFTMAGFFVVFAIPVLLKYLLLVLHTRSIDSRVTLIQHISGKGFKRRTQYLTLRVIYDGPDP